MDLLQALVWLVAVTAAAYIAEAIVRMVSKHLAEKRKLLERLIDIGERFIRSDLYVLLGKNAPMSVVPGGPLLPSDVSPELRRTIGAWLPHVEAILVSHWHDGWNAESVAELGKLVNDMREQLPPLPDNVRVYERYKKAHELLAVHVARSST